MIPSKVPDSSTKVGVNSESGIQDVSLQPHREPDHQQPLTSVILVMMLSTISVVISSKPRRRRTHITIGKQGYQNMT